MIQEGTLLLDSSACIYYLDRADQARHAVVASVVRDAERRHRRLVVSTVTIAETVTGAIRMQGDAEGKALAFLTRLCVPIAPTVEVAVRAARLRVEHGLTTPDALIAATAQLHADGVMGNDATWRSVEGLNYVHLDDLVEEQSSDG